MACDDGLVMTIHPGLRRNHHSPTSTRLDADIGCDSRRPGRAHRLTAATAQPVRHPPRPALRDFHRRRDGLLPGSRPAGGLLPVGVHRAPWWFLDAPEAIRRYRSAVTETAGSPTSGFIDDTRAFCSIRPATTCPADWMPATWRDWSPSTG